MTAKQTTLDSEKPVLDLYLHPFAVDRKVEIGRLMSWQFNRHYSLAESLGSTLGKARPTRYCVSKTRHKRSEYEVATMYLLPRVGDAYALDVTGEQGSFGLEAVMGNE